MIDESELQAIELREPFYFCNKCGYLGSVGPSHPHCNYSAARSSSDLIIDRLIAAVRELQQLTERADAEADKQWILGAHFGWNCAIADAAEHAHVLTTAGLKAAPNRKSAAAAEFQTAIGNRQIAIRDTKTDAAQQSSGEVLVSKADIVASIETYAETIASQNDLSKPVENWSDFHCGQNYAALELAESFRALPAKGVDGK